ncbi:MAG: L,D-transpeptidase family protein [Patescibacteria group bacterium]|jgi:lipoprotein-anchoring transpeptidase ErfK/SrfK
MNKKLVIIRLFIFSIFLLGSFVVIKNSQAATIQAGIFEANGKLIRKISNIPAGVNIAAADLNNDGAVEIIYGTATGKNPGIRILKNDGWILKNINLKNVKNKPAIRVAIGDINNDGKKEIITSFGQGTTPEIWIFDLNGKKLKTFLAYEKGFKGGVYMDVADVNGDKIDEIITAPGKGGGPRVAIFNQDGKKLSEFWAYPKNVRTGVIPLAFDLNNDGNFEIVTTKIEKNSLIKVFQADGNLTSTFKTSNIFPNNLKISNQNTLGSKNEIVLADAPGTSAQVISYLPNGQKGKIKFFPYGKNYTQGLSVATANVDGDSDQEIIVVPVGSEQMDENVGSGKLIVVDISEQKLKRYENGKLIKTYRVSTGKWSMPTPLGNFSIKNKMNVAYSRKYSLYMDNWMAFTSDGAYGIHSLPYWKLKNGGIYYEGVKHLGIRVSHGCIRLSPAESKEVFKWAEISTPVRVQN